MNAKILYMPFGICHLSVVPLRREPSHRSEMISQVVFGELIQVIDIQDNWCFVKLCFDNYEGWLDRKQFTSITDKQYRSATRKKIRLSHRWETKLRLKNTENELLYVPQGAFMTHNYLLGVPTSTQRAKFGTVEETAMQFLGVPYLWGGKTQYGIDCSGFVQLVYKLQGIRLPRDAYQQAAEGELISFLEESRSGDLAFFEDEEGNIIHVGILLGDNRIIHAHGKVRVDRIDHVGIYNKEIRNYSHYLRMMRRVKLRE